MRSLATRNAASNNAISSAPLLATGRVYTRQNWHAFPAVAASARPPSPSRVRACEAWPVTAGGQTRDRTPPPAGEPPCAAVPAEVADVLRPGLSGIVEEIITAVRAEVVEYDQP